MGFEQSFEQSFKGETPWTPLRTAYSIHCMARTLGGQRCCKAFGRAFGRAFAELRAELLQVELRAELRALPPGSRKASGLYAAAELTIATPPPNTARKRLQSRYIRCV